jgi:hypothetical protein
MTLRVLGSGRVNATPVHPYGVPLTAATQAIGFTNGGNTATRIITTGPTDGVWEVTSAASRAARTNIALPGAPPVFIVHPDVANYEVSIEAFKVTLDPATWTNDPTTVGTTYSKTFTAKNDFAAVSTFTTATAFASVRSVNATIAAGGAPQRYPINVLPGTTSLNVTIGGASDPGADLDLFVYNCTSGTCVLAGAGTGSTANESVTISSPTVGTWLALVDPFAVPSGSTTYTYTDSFANPVYGSVTTPPDGASRASGATWSIAASGRANQAAGTDRFLRASVSVREAATGTTLGGGTVIFANVTP